MRDRLTVYRRRHHRQELAHRTPGSRGSAVGRARCARWELSGSMLHPFISRATYEQGCMLGAAPPDWPWRPVEIRSRWAPSRWQWPSSC